MNNRTGDEKGHREEERLEEEERHRQKERGRIKTPKGMRREEM